MAIKADQTYIATIAFLDIVSYSKTSNREQVRLKSLLNGCISESLDGIDRDDLIVLDTGDGAALGFVSNPESGLRFARRFRDRLANCPDLQVRIGLHMGPITVLEDLNGLKNMVGDGINAAQRIMSFSNPGQIVVSQAYHDTVIRLDQDYVDLFAAARRFSDKHGRTHLCHELRDGKRQPPAAAEHASVRLPQRSPPRRIAAVLFVFLTLATLGVAAFYWQGSDKAGESAASLNSNEASLPTAQSTAGLTVPPAAIASGTLIPTSPPSMPAQPGSDPAAGNPSGQAQAATGTTANTAAAEVAAKAQGKAQATKPSEMHPTAHDAVSSPATPRNQAASIHAADNAPTPRVRPAPVAASGNDCPECNCSDLLTRLSMGTEAMSARQMAFLRQHCRQ